MSRKHEREERENWRRQQQNREGQWGSNWRDEDEYRRRGDEGMEDESRWQGMQNRGWGNEGRNYGGEYGGMQGDRGWDRGNQGRQGGNWQSGNWQGGRGGGWPGERWQGGGYQGGGYQGGGYEGRGEWNRDDWNQGMGGRWNQGSSRENWRGGGMQGQHAGRGPRSFKRQDDRIEEEINEQLTRHPMIDATDIEVKVQNGEVTMRGHVDSREAKRMAEDIAESVFGVKEVNNQIKIQHHGEQEERRERRAS